jgi:hypothetical protein
MHTPGPWTARKIDNKPENRWGNVVGADGRIVCTFYASLYDYRQDCEITANAVLIAAAPRLFDALTRLLEEAQSRFDGIDTTPEEDAAVEEAQAALDLVRPSL